MLTKHAGFIIALNMLMCAIDLQDINIKWHIFPDRLSPQLPFHEITTFTELWPPDRTNTWCRHLKLYIQRTTWNLLILPWTVESHSHENTITLLVRWSVSIATITVKCQHPDCQDRSWWFCWLGGFSFFLYPPHPIGHSCFYMLRIVKLFKGWMQFCFSKAHPLVWKCVILNMSSVDTMKQQILHLYNIVHNYFSLHSKSVSWSVFPKLWDHNNHPWNLG